MTYQFRKAVRSNTSLLLAFAGPSGSGKTYSALRVARGLVGTKGKIAVIDTEAGRALHYADRFEFDHLDMKPPFSPMAYQEAIDAAEQAGYGAIIIDSMSHEWAGEGGCQDMHDEAHDRMGGEERTNIVAWRDPKQAHKRMVSRLLQSRSHILFCLRAEEKVKFVKNDKGKIVIEPIGWQPICEKNFMYEQTVSFMLTDEHPGYGIPIKLQEQHKAFFRPKETLDEKAGELLAEWAHGTLVHHEPAKATVTHEAPPATQGISDEEWLTALTKIDDNEVWAEVKQGVKDELKIPDLRRVKPEHRETVLGKILSAGVKQGVAIEV